MTTLRLGDFIFGRGEVPESISFGAAQQLHVHTLVGGGRVIDAMGAVPQRQEWSGWFTGPQALARARFLKRLTEAGEPLPLRYGEFAYTVVIANFSAEFRAGANLPYAIALEVVSDHGAATASVSRPGLTQVITQDLIGAAAYAQDAGDGGLIAAVAEVAVAATASETAATPAAMPSLLPPIAIAQARARQQDIVASEQISAVGALAASDIGSDPVNPETVSRFSGSLVAAAAAAQRSCQLHATIQLLGRAAVNLAAAGGHSDGGGPVLTTGSTDLYHLAAAAYGDARGWTQIARANHLTDPAIVGINRLVIPPNAGKATGVLNG